MTHGHEPLARISTGTVRGSRSGEGVDRFLGIPYAAPPVGAARFAVAEPAVASEGARDATRFGATPPQSPYPGRLAAILPTVRIDGDDILTVNVWAPESADRLPVLFWVHGGALERGTPALPSYDGTAFARDGVVFVSVGYRLGSEGFSVLDGAARNVGLTDVAAALHWVHREIAAFGGDPDRITAVGESAGGLLVAALTARPDTADLLAGVVIGSGPLAALPPERAGRVTRGLARRLDVPATRAAFESLTPEDLVAARSAQAAGSSPLGGAPSFALALDPDSLPVSPAAGLARFPGPVLIGTNADEYRLWFTPGALSRIRPLTLQIARLAQRIPAAALRAYRAAAPGASAGELLGQLATDLILRAPAVRAARARTAPTYVYEFAWPTPVQDLRAAHALELAFVFDRVGTPDADAFAGPDAPAALATRVHGDWVRFVRDGEPGWPAFAGDRPVLRYDVQSRETPLRAAAALDLLPDR